MIHEENPIYNYVPAAVRSFCSVADIIDESEHKQQHIAVRHRYEFHIGPNRLAERDDNSFNNRPDIAEQQQLEPKRPERN
ncbi:MAG: hypothetical protein JWO13_2109 [Acidobacteriales bacterium]|nr:hypothetical protein [Terriglobales bacterium]